MKKLAIMFAIALAGVAGACSSDKTTTDVNELPVAAQKFVADNFDSKVSHIVIDKELFGDSYEAILSDGTKVEFDKSGEWEKIEAPYGETVPPQLIPKSIADYMSQHFEGHSIIKIDRDNDGYEVELQNELELHFDTNGTFRSIDD